MTVTVTPREIRSPQNGAVPGVDSPAVSTRARARIPVTVRIGKIVAGVKVAGARWWGWTARPLPLGDMWTQSTVDVGRIPNKSGALRILWQVSNWTDRLVIFALIMAAPTAATGPLRWIACRPTRRWGMYLTTATLALIYFITKD